MTGKLYGYVGIGIAILALIGVVAWEMNSLMKKGIELGKAKSEIAFLEAQVEQANKNVASAKETLKLTKDARDRWLTAAANYEQLYNASLEVEPRIIYRTHIERIPEVIPLGNCDTAAVASWELLHDAGIIREGP